MKKELVEGIACAVGGCWTTPLPELAPAGSCSLRHCAASSRGQDRGGAAMLPPLTWIGLWFG